MSKLYTIVKCQGTFPNDPNPEIAPLRGYAAFITSDRLNASMDIHRYVKNAQGVWLAGDIWVNEYHSNRKLKEIVAQEWDDRTKFSFMLVADHLKQAFLKTLDVRISYGEPLCDRSFNEVHTRDMKNTLFKFNYERITHDMDKNLLDIAIHNALRSG